MDGRALAGLARWTVHVAGQVAAPQPPVGNAARVPSRPVAKIDVDEAANGLVSDEPTEACHSTAPVAPSRTNTTPSLRATATFPVANPTAGPTIDAGAPPTSVDQVGHIVPAGHPATG